MALQKLIPLHIRLIKDLFFLLPLHLVFMLLNPNHFLLGGQFQQLKQIPTLRQQVIDDILFINFQQLRMRTDYLSVKRSFQTSRGQVLIPDRDRRCQDLIPLVLPFIMYFIVQNFIVGFYICHIFQEKIPGHLARPINPNRPRFLQVKPIHLIALPKDMFPNL
jgi:hypothetical protein